MFNFAFLLQSFFIFGAFGEFLFCVIPLFTARF